MITTENERVTLIFGQGTIVVGADPLGLRLSTIKPPQEIGKIISIKDKNI